MPVKYFFGQDCLKSFGSEIFCFGKRPMIITGKKSAELSGALQDIKECLSMRKIGFIVFDEVTENPEISNVLKAARIFSESKCDFLIGVGGGSPIDAAKAVSAYSANGFKYREIFDAQNIKKIYPVVAIPTTSGTGSEVTQYTVLSDSEIKMKCGVGHKFLYPVLSFIDPKYSLSAPLRVTKDTAVDALSHLLEGIYSNKRNRLTYPLIFEGVKIILKNLPLCLKEPQNIEFRKNLSAASLYGGLTISQSSTTLQHSIGYPLTSRFGLSHGAANGIVMKGIMNLYNDFVEKELKLLFDCLNISQKQFFSFVDSLEYNYKLDIINKDFSGDIIKEVMESRNFANNPAEFSYKDIFEIYKSISV